METINDAIILEETALLEQDEDANEDTTTTYVIIYEGFPPEETPQIEQAQPQETGDETTEAPSPRKRGRPKRGVDPLAIAESSVHNHDSDPADSSSPPNKKFRNRQTKSYIWKYFTKLSSTKSRCNIEGCQKKTFSSSITSLKYHLRRIHGIIETEDVADSSPEKKMKESPSTSKVVTRKTRGILYSIIFLIDLIIYIFLNIQQVALLEYELHGHPFPKRKPQQRFPSGNTSPN